MYKAIARGSDAPSSQLASDLHARKQANVGLGGTFGCYGSTNLRFEIKEGTVEMWSLD